MPYLRLLLFVGALCFAGCGSRTYTMTQFPWKRVGDDAIQESANEAMRANSEYYGNIRIVHLPKKFNSHRKPQKEKTIVEISGFLRKDNSTPILKRSFSVLAHDLDVVARDGNATQCKIVIEDASDGEQWRIDLTFDVGSKKLKIVRLSPNLTDA